MKRLRIEVLIRKNFVVYADDEDEAMDRALEEEIHPDDVEFTMVEELHPDPL